MINMLNPFYVKAVAASMKGARKDKFLASVKVINDSLEQGSWIPRGSTKAQAGFYQGLYTKVGQGEHKLYMTLRFGQAYQGDTSKLPDLERSWVSLCNQVDKAKKQLDEARPKPVVTAIGLSPKVTKTLQDCNLDIDLPSIKMAKIVPVYGPKRDQDGNEVLGLDGKPVMELKGYKVEWSEGVVHNQSRFVSGCQACGKHIPSGRFVPVEADCKRTGKRISMWLGCDCAANIFGIKDVGVEKAPV